MIICPNLSNPEVAREFNELVQATSELAAYHIWSLNNGNAIDRAPNGAPSKLFLTLLEHYNGDRAKAIQAKAKIYGKSFLKWFGDWTRVAKLENELNVEGITNEEYAFNGDDFIDRLIKSKKWSEIAIALKKKLSNLSNIKFYYADFSTYTPGIYGHDNIIYLNRNYSSSKTQLHEFIHAITSIEYENNPEFKKQIDELYLFAVNDSRFGKKALQNNVFYSENIYGYSNPKEFLAESFSNRDFADILQRIPYNKKESVWQKFTNILKNLFGLFKEDTVFDAVINSIFEYSKVNDSISKNVSKVIDENGEPLIVYHGGSMVNVFDTTGKRKAGGAGIIKGDNGTYFTTSKASAVRYEKIHDYKVGDGLLYSIHELEASGMTDEEIEKEWNSSLLALRSGTRAFFLNITNPKKRHYENDSMIGKKSYKPVDTDINDKNDGQIITRGDTLEVEYVAFNPNQIKSVDNAGATPYEGTFSRENDNVYDNTSSDGLKSQLKKLGAELMKKCKGQ